MVIFADPQKLHFGDEQADVEAMAAEVGTTRYGNGRMLTVITVLILLTDWRRGNVGIGAAVTVNDA